MIDFVSGAVALGYSVAAVFFFRFWRKTADRLFLSFGLAFVLLTVNQVFAALLEAGDERAPYVYTLRVLGFLLILWAIVDKNLVGTSPRR